MADSSAKTAIQAAPRLTMLLSGVYYHHLLDFNLGLFFQDKSDLWENDKVHFGISIFFFFSLSSFRKDAI